MHRTAGMCLAMFRKDGGKHGNTYDELVFKLTLLNVHARLLLT